MIASTWRFSFYGTKIKEQSIALFWHDEIYPVTKYMEHTNSVALVSPSRDGDIVTSFVLDWGHEIIRGSSDKNSSGALRLIIKTAKNRKMFITPDGPRGPRHKIKLGSIIAAQKAKVPLYLIRAKCNGYRFKKSWDKFLIPYPFTKIKIILSEPNYIPENYDRNEIEKLALIYENWMNQ